MFSISFVPPDTVESAWVRWCLLVENGDDLRFEPHILYIYTQLLRYISQASRAGPAGTPALRQQRLLCGASGPLANRTSRLDAGATGKGTSRQGRRRYRGWVGTGQALEARATGMLRR